jgi:hypothetical protein
MTNWKQDLEKYSKNFTDQYQKELSVFIENIQKPNGFAYQVEWKAGGMAELEYKATKARLLVAEAITFATAQEALDFLNESRDSFREEWILSVHAQNSTNPFANALNYVLMDAKKDMFSSSFNAGLYGNLIYIVKRSVESESN